MIAHHIVGVDAVRAYRPGRAAFTQDYLKIVREKPEVLQPSNGDLTPHTLEVLLVEDMGKRFTGRRTFVEDLEQLVPYFYDVVGQNLRTWQAQPPKLVKVRLEENIDDDPGAGVNIAEPVPSEDCEATTPNS